MNFSAHFKRCGVKVWLVTAVGNDLLGEETLTMLHDMGIDMITCGTDFNYIVNGARKTFETVKKVIG